MTIATTKEATAGQGDRFETTSTVQEEVGPYMFSQSTDITTPQSVGRHVALGGRMPSDAVRLIAPDPVNEPGFGYRVVKTLPIDLPTVSGNVEVISDTGSSTWEVELVNLDTRSRGLTPQEAFRLSRVLYAAGKQAQLLNEGITPELAVLLGESILRHPAGTR